jgi:GNAT superfamily N-acetyltransferase
MPPLTIIKVASRRDLKSFIDLPWKLYKVDKHWIAPLRIDIKSRLNLKRGLLGKGRAALFLARRDKEVVGRISASFLKSTLQATGEGNFGFYEMIDDLDVARALMDRAMAWLKEKGAKKAIGPYSFLLEDPYPAFLADSYDRPPYFMMTYSKPYYLDQMKALGFEKAQDLYAYEMSEEVPLPQKLLDKAKEAEYIPDLRLRTINLKNLYEEIEITRGIFNEALKNNWGYVPFSREYVKKMAKELRFLADERIIFIAEIKGVPVGVVINLPNYNELLADCNGRLFLKGVLRILFKKRLIKSARNYAMAILPAYQHSGLGSLLLRESFNRAVKIGYVRGEISFVLESNVKMDALAQFARGRNRKTYRIFKKDI